jgi:hypothetical protein
MMRRLLAVAVGVGMFGTSSLARAQGHEEFGRRGQIIISADRLVPVFSYTHTSQDQFDPGLGNSKQVVTNNQTALSILWGSTYPSGAETFFTVPRVGFDYVIVPNVTIGGDIVVFFTLGGSNGTETTQTNGTSMTTSRDNPGALVFGIAPRGGYIFELSNLFSLWLRGGLSYYVMNSKTTTGSGNAQTTTSFSVNKFALDLNPQFVITPTPHFGFTLGLTADIPLAGGHSQEIDVANRSITNSASSSLLFFGVTGGLLGYF